MKSKPNLLGTVWAMIFSISFTGSVYYLSENSVSVPIALLIIAINAVLLGAYTIKFIRSISLLDEVQIRIQLEAVSVAFALSILLVMILGMVALVSDLGMRNIHYLYVFPLLFLFYFIGLFISQRKYK